MHLFQLKLMPTCGQGQNICVGSQIILVMVVLELKKM